MAIKYFVDHIKLPLNCASSVFAYFLIENEKYFIEIFSEHLYLKVVKIVCLSLDAFAVQLFQPHGNLYC